MSAPLTQLFIPIWPDARESMPVKLDTIVKNANEIWNKQGCTVYVHQVIASHQPGSYMVILNVEQDSVLVTQNIIKEMSKDANHS